jgi:hypothetical protein
MMRKIFGGIGRFLKHPIGVILVTNVVWYVIVRTVHIPFNIGVNVVLIITDGLVAYFLLDRLIYFFSQFVLPIQNQKHRKEIYSRVRDFETESQGPALFIKNGSLIEHKGEQTKHGAGVIVLDTASAAVLRTDTQIKDTIGPGVVFTKVYKTKNDTQNEYIAGYVDLRSQWKFIGPQIADQPFLNPVPISPKEYNDVQNRRQQTSGMTRDGIEVSPTISFKFRVKRPEGWPEIKKPTESGVKSYYGYDADSVRSAITHEIVDLAGTEDKKICMEWNKLPEHLVVNVWREYIRKFKFDDLFTSSEISESSGLKTIEKMINKRLRQPTVEVLDHTGRKADGQLESLEFKQLQFRGLEIMEVRIHNVLFDKDIEKKIIERWSVEWLKAAIKEEKLLMVEQSSKSTLAREEASRSFAKMVSKKFSSETPLPKNKPFKTLKLLLQPIKEFIRSEGRSNSEMDDELRKLDDIWKWLLDNDPVDANENSSGKSRNEE